MPINYMLNWVFCLVTSILLWEKEEQACWPSTRGTHQSWGGSKEEREKEEEEETALCAQEEALLSLSGQHTCWVSTGTQYLERNNSTTFSTSIYLQTKHGNGNFVKFCCGVWLTGQRGGRRSGWRWFLKRRLWFGAAGWTSGWLGAIVWEVSARHALSLPTSNT